MRRIENDKPWIYQQVTSAIKERKLTSNVCRPYGVVIDKSENENASRMIGVLFEYITHKGTLADVAPGCKNQRQFSNWVDDLKTIAHNMHEAGLVWGDGKPANVLVDHEDNKHPNGHDPAPELVLPVLQSFVIFDGRGLVEGQRQLRGALPTYKNNPCRSPPRHLVG